MATYMAEQGVDQRDIQRWGGWSNIETVSIYTHLDTTRVRSEQLRAGAHVGCHHRASHSHGLDDRPTKAFRSQAGEGEHVGSG